jgi:hypothetical protein
MCQRLSWPSKIMSHLCLCGISMNFVLVTIKKGIPIASDPTGVGRESKRPRNHHHVIPFDQPSYMALIINKYILVIKVGRSTNGAESSVRSGRTEANMRNRGSSESTVVLVSESIWCEILSSIYVCVEEYGPSGSESVSISSIAACNGLTKWAPVSGS